MQPWVMRPCGSTWVASTMTRPAPEFASMPRWARCQSVAQPSTALYWHMGETTMRLSNSTPPSLIGENSVLGMRCGPCGKRKRILRAERGSEYSGYIDDSRGRNLRAAQAIYAEDCDRRLPPS